MGQPVMPGQGNPIRLQGIKLDVQIGTLPANAIRASRMKRLHQQAGYKAATSVDKSRCYTLLSRRRPYKRCLRCHFLGWAKSFWYSADILSMYAIAALYCSE